MDQATPTFEQFLATNAAQISSADFLMNMALTIGVCLVLAALYRRFGESLSNRSRFAGNFALLGATTMLIITIVKSSLALSLGLVGALSIVRFRAAIKEPEELAYLFLCIAVGLGFGAGQTETTLLAMVPLMLLIVAKGFRPGRPRRENLVLTVTLTEAGSDLLGRITAVLAEHCDAVDLRRFDDEPELLEASFLVSIAGADQLEKARQALRELHPDLRIAFLDVRGLS